MPSLRFEIEAEIIQDPPREHDPAVSENDQLLWSVSDPLLGLRGKFKDVTHSYYLFVDMSLGI